MLVEQWQDEAFGESTLVLDTDDLPDEGGIALDKHIPGVGMIVQALAVAANSRPCGGGKHPPSFVLDADTGDAYWRLQTPLKAASASGVESSSTATCCDSESLTRAPGRPQRRRGRLRCTTLTARDHRYLVGKNSCGCHP